MQITNLPASSSFAANDVLAIEVNGTTYKVTGATLAAALQTIGEFVTTSDTVTTTQDGLMTASDKTKLNGIAAGAQVNSITGVKGNAEGSYRVGNINLTPANIGALALSGGTMTGNLSMGQSTSSSGAKQVKWTTADDTLFYIRPYNNLFQIVREPSGGSASNALGINSDGSISMDNKGGWRDALGIKSGVITASSVAAGSYADSTVTFTGKAYSANPIVVVGFRTGSTAGVFGHCSCAVVTGSISTTGFTARVFNGDTTARAPELVWIAIG